MDFQNRAGGKTGSGGVASWSETNRDRRERLRQLALETIDLNKDPYFMKNHLGSYECKLCLTLHNNEGSYLAHTQGKKHQQNLARRAAKEAREAPLQPAPEKQKISLKKFVKIGRPGYKVTKQRDSDTGQHSLLFQIDYPEIAGHEPKHRFMSAYEQRIEPPDKSWQYLLVAAEPYETIGFKVPSREIDKNESKFWTFWNKDTKQFFLQFHFKLTHSQITQMQRDAEELDNNRRERRHDAGGRQQSFRPPPRHQFPPRPSFGTHGGPRGPPRMPPPGMRGPPPQQHPSSQGLPQHPHQGQTQGPPMQQALPQGPPQSSSQVSSQGPPQAVTIIATQSQGLQIQGTPTPGAPPPSLVSQLNLPGPPPIMAGLPPNLPGPPPNLPGPPSNMPGLPSNLAGAPQNLPGLPPNMPGPPPNLPGPPPNLPGLPSNMPGLPPNLPGPPSNLPGPPPQ